MASKRQSSPPASSRSLNSADKSKKIRLAHPPYQASNLPFDPLCKIFSYAPRYLRLRSFSRVCTHWRAAVLRTIDSLSFTKSDPAALASLVKRLPSLTALDIGPTVGHFALPTKVTRLSLVMQYCVMAAKATERGESTFLTAHFPHLTALNLSAVMDGNFVLSGDEEGVLRPKLSSFLLMHQSQIRELDFGYLGHMGMHQVATQQWPALESLHLHFRTGRVVKYSGVGTQTHDIC